MKQFGRIDILINNAAIFDLAPISEITRESYERVFAVNVSGMLFMMQVKFNNFALKTYSRHPMLIILSGIFDSLALCPPYT